MRPEYKRDPDSDDFERAATAAVNELKRMQKWLGFDDADMLEFVKESFAGFMNEVGHADAVHGHRESEARAEESEEATIRLMKYKMRLKEKFGEAIMLEACERMRDVDTILRIPRNTFTDLRDEDYDFAVAHHEEDTILGFVCRDAGETAMGPYWAEEE